MAVLRVEPLDLGGELRRLAGQLRANSSAESSTLRSAMLNVTVVDPAATSRIGLWSS